jgi:hypothetical protein
MQLVVPHHIEFQQHPDVLDIRVIRYRVLCRRCGCCCEASLDTYSYLSTGAGDNRILRQLMQEWEIAFPADCDEAASLNLIRSVQET